MKFFRFIQESIYSHYHWANPYGAPNTPEPFYPKYSQYSILRCQLPKNGDPGIAFLIPEILYAMVEMPSLLIALLSCLYSGMVDILHGYVHVPYSLRPIKCAHSRCYILE